MNFGGVRFLLRISLLALVSTVPLVAAENAHLSIDASKPGVKIDRNLFGQFAENLGHGLYEGIWVGKDSPIPNTRGIRNDVVTALRELRISPKSKTHVRSLVHTLVEFAMWAGMLDISRNPVSLVRNTGATRKVRNARSLTAEQFHALLKELQEPFATMALLSVCLGLRVSEALALQWADVDWLGSRLGVRRGIVNQIVGDVKTQGSAKTFNLAGELLERLKTWKQSSEFS